MSTTMSAHEPTPPRFQVTDVQPPPPRDRMFGFSPTVTVRVLTAAEAVGAEEVAGLPQLNWSVTCRLALEMVEPYRTYRKRADGEYYEEEFEDSMIPHEAFVKAHEFLPYVESDYCNYIYLTRGHESRLFKGHRESFGERYFDLARDFIRECALNGYWATYG